MMQAFAAATATATMSWTEDRDVDVGLLFVAMMRAAEQIPSLHPGEISTQELANMVWSFATTAQLDEQLFEVVARAAEVRLDEFSPQNLANTAWAFAKANQPDKKLR